MSAKWINLRIYYEDIPSSKLSLAIIKFVRSNALLGCSIALKIDLQALNWTSLLVFLNDGVSCLLSLSVYEFA